MTPLVVRPRPQADELARRLRTAGHTPIIQPLVECVPGTDLPTLSALLSQSDLVIVVSRHAALFAQAHLSHTGQTWPNIDYLAIGKASADALAAAGITARWPDDPRSEGVLALPELQGVAGKRVLILRGNGGRDLIAEQLTERGALVTCACIYERRYLAQGGSALPRLATGRPRQPADHQRRAADRAAGTGASSR